MVIYWLTTWVCNSTTFSSIKRTATHMDSLLFVQGSWCSKLALISYRCCLRQPWQIGPAAHFSESTVSLMPQSLTQDPNEAFRRASCASRLRFTNMGLDNEMAGSCRDTDGADHLQEHHKAYKQASQPGLESARGRCLCDTQLLL